MFHEMSDTNGKFAVQQEGRGALWHNHVVGVGEANTGLKSLNPS